MKRLRARGLGIWAASLVSLACSLDSGQASFEVPPRERFESVSSAVVAHCGSLDCHGRVEQNLRLYGLYGLRLDEEDVVSEGDTTELEHDANYQSLVMLEPELLAAVFRDSGARAERLTLIRKARGSEAHKGKTVFAADSAGDRCLVSWVSGDVDAEACEQAEALPASPFAQ